MRERMRGRGASMRPLAAGLVAAALLAGCSATSKSMISKPRSSEYFSEAEYGVKASPRVSTERSRLPRGGGRDQLGKPYKVRGVWYYPKEVRDYSKVGAASWYGDAFHGRLTANGEIYDMTHLTAAHPTMPLPSYARVTNLANGSSVVVRVNDRGPYAPGRIIDLSKRAADMLDYAHAGVAKVKVDYIGRAPLDGQDDAYLLASYQPGGRAPDPSDGLGSGVMVAMNGATPGAPAAAAAFPGLLGEGGPTVSFAGGTFALPETVPVAPERPHETRLALAAMSYAPADAVASQAAAALESVLSPAEARDPAAFVAVGTFATEGEAARLVAILGARGAVEVERSEEGGRSWFAVTLRPDGRTALDGLLTAAWDAGATDAILVRD